MAKLRKNSLSLGRGVKVLRILNFLCGHWFHVYPRRFRRCSPAHVAAYFYVMIVNCVGVLLFVLNIGYIINFNIMDFGKVTYLAAGLFGTAQSIVCTISIVYNKRNICKLLVSLRTLINQSIFYHKQKKIIQKLSRYIITMLLFLMFAYLIGIVISFLNVILCFKFTSFEYSTSSVVIADLMSSFKKIFRVLRHPVLVGMYVIFSYGITILCIMKVVVTDVLFYACYELLLEQYELLTHTLEPAVRRAAKHPRYLLPWIQFHQQINRSLQELNSLTAVTTIVAVVVNTLQVCLVAYITVEGILDRTHGVIMVLYGLLALFQTFMYCNIGHKLKQKVCGLQCAAYRSSWVHACRGTQQAVQLLSAASATSCTLPGAPFFPLSLEFFASVIGAVFTYFIVLYQLKS